MPRRTDLRSTIGITCIEPITPNLAQRSSASIWLDGSNEGIACEARRAFRVQYHLEASPGPSDSAHLFRRFTAMISEQNSYV